MQMVYLQILISGFASGEMQNKTVINSLAHKVCCLLYTVVRTWYLTWSPCQPDKTGNIIIHFIKEDQTYESVIDLPLVIC